MAKYLIHGSYSPDGVKGLMRDGGTTRRTFVKGMIEKAGGSVEAFYFAFGDSDVYVICDVPDVASIAALSLAVNASGAVSLRTVLLITPEEMDAAAKKDIGYKPPGA